MAPSRFLICLLVAIVAGCGSSPETPPKAPETASWLVDVTEAVGVDFAYDPGAHGALHMPEVAGSGVALFDYDNDGDLDIYFTNGNGQLPEASADSATPNRLYRADGGKYVDVTATSGLGDGGYGNGVAVGDIDNDGFVDVYVANYGPDRLYRNRGDGTFEDITAAAGIDRPEWTSSVAFLDFDRDGLLDIYVAEYVRYDRDKRCYNDAGRQTYCGPRVFAPVHDRLLRNLDGHRFEDVSDHAGMSTVAGAGLGVACADYDGDGWIDVYVANDGYANQLWTNQRDGTFKDQAVVLGAAVNLHGQAQAGMGVIAADLDGDTNLDLFMTHLAAETNTIYRNMGGTAGFVDESGQSGLGASSMPYTGFGVVAFDLELDGDLDLAIANGRVTQAPPLAGAPPPPWDEMAEPNLFYVNDGRGRFELAGDAAAAFTGPIEVSRGLAAGDLDQDGDIDLVLTNIAGRARIYRNEAPRAGHWVSVRAIDPRLKRDAIGATVTIDAGRKYVGVVFSAIGYQSSSPPVVHFGLGATDTVTSIGVAWPDGLREVFPGGPADRAIVLRRGEGRANDG